ncbi:hypothetical protein [Tissierella sp.]|uniref:hypothetical protein n=1 Tax=Tissierella sp. TaxID=41274 RepID=UPI00286773EC|nr:hypothetical protein [Tissierella sp.]MDR7855931.1 hypothetical protein [Tissierella sp.]
MDEIKPKYYIPYNSSNPAKKYALIEEEVKFLDKLLEKSSHLKGEFQLSRLSDGTVNVAYNRYPVGKIKLQGRKHTMLVLTSLYKNKTIEGGLDEFIIAIDIWIKYISNTLKLK